MKRSAQHRKNVHSGDVRPTVQYEYDNNITYHF